MVVQPAKIRFDHEKKQMKHGDFPAKCGGAVMAIYQL
jgi:hypothetical protein